MINYIWGFLMLASLVVSMFTGRVDETIQAAFSGANGAITTILGFAGAMAMWTGIMKIADKSGLVKIFSKLIRPLTRVLFPKLKKGSDALNAISMNMVANILGLANAATPLGLKAMGELEKLNPHPGTATTDMCMFVVLNTASIQLIPSTLIAIRASMQSANPSEIILPIWITSIITATCACVSVKLASRTRAERAFQACGKKRRITA